MKCLLHCLLQYQKDSKSWTALKKYWLLFNSFILSSSSSILPKVILFSNTNTFWHYYKKIITLLNNKTSKSSSPSKGSKIKWIIRLFWKWSTLIVWLQIDKSQLYILKTIIQQRIYQLMKKSWLVFSFLSPNIFSLSIKLKFKSKTVFLLSQKIKSAKFLEILKS